MLLLLTSIAEDVEDASSPLTEEPDHQHHHYAPPAGKSDHFHLVSSASFRHRTTHHHHLHPQTGARRLSASATMTGIGHGSESFPSRSKSFLEFEVGDCFLLGSPLALILAFRKYDSEFLLQTSPSLTYEPLPLLQVESQPGRAGVAAATLPRHLQSLSLGDIIEKVVSLCR